MPRVNYVAKARQRYAPKPIIDPATGQQKRVPVMKNGKQVTDKRGKPVTRKLSEPDLEKPLPLRECDAPGCPEPDRIIQVGTPFKWIAIKRAYGGIEKYRHKDCPTWQVWEYSDSLSARISRIQHDAGLDLANADDEDGFTDACSSAADAIRELADEKEEAGQNMEDGFQHETEQSAELKDIAEQLREWADAVESAYGDSGIDEPEPEPEECRNCGGTGKVETDESAPELENCEECGGTTQVTSEEPTEEQMEDWRQEVRDALQEVIDNSPI